MSYLTNMAKDRFIHQHNVSHVMKTNSLRLWAFMCSSAGHIFANSKIKNNLFKRFLSQFWDRTVNGWKYNNEGWRDAYLRPEKMTIKMSTETV